MNQILDHSGPKKQKKYRNPDDTARIIKVYALLIMVFAICLIGKAAYSISENKKINKTDLQVITDTVPQIVLNADKDILTINVSSANKGIEWVAYQWYRGDATLEEIKEYQLENDSQELLEDDENDDEETNVDEEKIIAIGEIKTEKSTKDVGQNEMLIQNIGIPKGETTVYVTVKTIGNSEITEYVQSYYTEVGVDKIEPQINVAIQGKKLVVKAIDETEIDYLTYSINGEQEIQVDDRTDRKTIKTEIDLIETASTEVTICAVDKAKNSKVYQKSYDVYAGKPKIEFLGEGTSDSISKIYVKITYARGIKKVVYDLNGEEYSKEFDNPDEAREVNFEIDTVEGHNLIKVWAYTEQEEVWAMEEGECEYNPDSESHDD